MLLLFLWSAAAATARDENKENEPIVIDSAIEIALLNETIKDLRAKLQEAMDLEEEKQQIENGTYFLVLIIWLD